MQLRTETTEEIRAIAREKKCHLLAVESSGLGRASVLRLVLEREDGSSVSVEDCEAVSREVSALLDASDEISHGYSLDDARRFVGRRVRVKTDIPTLPEASNGSGKPAVGSRNLRGTLERVEDDVLRLVDEENRKTYNVRFGDIRLARLEFEWPARRG